MDHLSIAFPIRPNKKAVYIIILYVAHKMDVKLKELLYVIDYNMRYTRKCFFYVTFVT